MLAGIKEKGYIYIKNFFSKEELNFLQPYCLKKTLTCAEENLICNQSAAATWFYDDFIMDIFLENKLKKVEEISQLTLNKTYAFWRGYTFGSILPDHKDRPSCEISVTACIDSDGTQWPIHFDGNLINISVGDGVMYLGCDLNHGRPDEFKGSYMAQVFMHYVDVNGPFKDHANDQITKAKKIGFLK